MRTVFILPIAILLALYVPAQTVEFNYICPVPGSRFINPQQVITLRTGMPLEPESLHRIQVWISGTRSGPIGYDLSLSADLKTLFIQPIKEFFPGERIDICISGGLMTSGGIDVADTSFSFMTREIVIPRQNPFPEPETITSSPDAGIRKSSQNRDNNLPEDYPAPTYVYTGPGVAEGYTFFTPNVRLTPQWEQYITIWDNYGTPIYYCRVDKTVTDFKVLQDGVLTYAVNGLQNPEQDCYYLMDSNYDVFDSIRAGNGYYIDNHDILSMDNGHYLIMIYDQQVINMSLIVPGGDPAALVTGLVIQEVDVNGNVYFQWRSWDHLEITDATWDIDLTSHWIDYVHANAIDFDSDGNILVSCRHLDEVTKIDFNTGEIIWRFGKNAENNQFDFVNDPLGFSHQHDIRKLANGNYTVYDNGNLHAPPFSRAVEYHLDEETMEATLVWQYEHDPSIYAPLTGGNQKLPNNNRLIGWGGTSPIALTEVNNANQVVFELYLPDSITGYRARKYNWETTVFSAQPEIDFGNFEGFQTPKRYLLQVTNNYQQTIQITSSYNHTSEFFTSTLLPASIPPGGTVDLLVQFEPGNTGNFQDVLTLNYDNPGNTERIARQITLKGLWDASLLSAIFVPESGAQNVDPDGLITLTFNEPARKIFHQELEDSDVPYLFNFRLTNVYGEDVPFHGTVSEDKTIITLFPDETLNEFQQYFIELKPNMLEDYQGNVMNYPEFCFFTTGEQVNIISPDTKSDIVFYPNPVNGILKVASSGDPIERIEIYTPDGRLLWEAGINSCEAELNTDSFPKGLLVVMIREQGGDWLPFRVVKL